MKRYIYTPIVLEWARARIRKGYCPIILITGEQRSGKTCLALWFAQQLQRNFNPDEQLFFQVSKYAKAVHKFNNKVLVLDEAGIELDTYKYSDARQRCFSHVIQSQAYKQNTLILCLPHNTDIAKCHRKYIKMLICVTGHGRYKAYKPVVQYWDMNDLDITTSMVEEVHEIPLPTNDIYNAYKGNFEKQIKKDILESEIDKLDKKLNPETKSSYESQSVLTPELMAEAQALTMKLSNQKAS